MGHGNVIASLQNSCQHYFVAYILFKFVSSCISVSCPVCALAASKFIESSFKSSNFVKMCSAVEAFSGLLDCASFSVCSALFFSRDVSFRLEHAVTGCLSNAARISKSLRPRGLKENVAQQFQPEKNRGENCDRKNMLLAIAPT